METDQINRWKLLNDKKERWYVFINYAFLKYRGDSRKTVAQLAREIGVSQGLLTQWMQRNGRVPTSLESITKLASYFGDVIYEVLCVDFSSLSDNEVKLPKFFNSLTDEITESISELGISGESPEAERVAIEILRKHGFSINTPENSSL